MYLPFNLSRTTIAFIKYAIFHNIITNDTVKKLTQPPRYRGSKSFCKRKQVLRKYQCNK